MRPDRIEIEVRARRPWEATDLGLLLVRRWFWPIQRQWLTLVALPWLSLWIAVALLDARWLWLVALLFWWLRPLSDRIPLHFLSGAVFGVRPTLTQTLRTLPRLLRRHLLWQPLLLRLSLTRALALPVFQLEGLSAKASRRRTRALRTRSQDIAPLWAILCLALELLLLIFLPRLVGLFVPALGRPDWIAVVQSLDTPFFAWERADAIGLGVYWVLAHSLVEPFFVGGGFGIYLNRRILLEGWDVEMRLRALGHRLERRRRGQAVRRRASTWAPFLLPLLLAVAAAGEMANAQQATAADRSSTGQEDHRQLIGADPPMSPNEVAARVLDHEDFGGTRTVRRLRLEDRQQDEEERQERSAAFVLPGISGLASVIEGGLWVALVAVVVALVYVLRKLPEDDNPLVEQLTVETAEPATFDLDRASLPPDVPGTARRALARGDAALCLSLLFRGALAALTDRGVIEIRPGWTEGDCLRSLRDTGGTSVPYFARLTRAWCATAYAQRTPPQRDIEEICDGWAEHFAVTETAP